MTLPPNWPVMNQPAPNNLPATERAVRLLEPGIDGRTHFDAQSNPIRIMDKPEGPLRRLAGPLLADAAIARADAIGIPKYGSYVTAHNGHNQAVQALQELSDAVTYLSAWWDETDSHPAKMHIQHAINLSGSAAAAIQTALDAIEWQQKEPSND